MDTLVLFYRVEILTLSYLRKDLAKREFDRRVESLEYACGNFLGSLRRSGRIGRLGRGVQYPHVWYSHGEVVVDALLNTRPAVFRRENFDANKGRLGEDLFSRFRAADYADIGDPKAG